MNKLLLTLSIYENSEYLDDVEIEIEVPEALYSQLIELAKKCECEQCELSEEVLLEELPQLHQRIEDSAQQQLPSLVDYDSEEELEAIEAVVSYPDDLSVELL